MYKNLHETFTFSPKGWGGFLTKPNLFWISVVCECEFIFQHFFIFYRNFKSKVKFQGRTKCYSKKRSPAVGVNTSFFPSLLKSRDVCWAVALFCRADDETAAVWKFVSCVGYKLILYICRLFVVRTGWLFQFLYAWRLGSRITLVSCAK